MASAWEIAAVVLALAYLLLAICRSAWCWPAAIASTSIYIFLMYAAGLYMESALQIFYLAIAFYGWRQWTHARPSLAERGSSAPTAATGFGGPESQSQRPAQDRLRVTTRPLQFHVVTVVFILTASGFSGRILSVYTDAAWPYVDSFTTWGAMITTWMVARKILENWIYWFVIDGVSMVMYVNRELYYTAGLFALYLILVVVGYRAWKQSMNSEIGVR